MWYKRKDNQPILALSPMADMTDSPFCRVCREVELNNSDHARGEEESLVNTLKDASHSIEFKPKEKGCLIAVRDYQPFVIFREMVSAEAIVRGSEKTLKMAEFDEIERPIVLQLFGGKADVIVEAARIITQRPFDSACEGFTQGVNVRPEGLDINMGCPVPKIAGKSMAGASLMRDQERAVAIVNALKNADLGLPISVKTRLGWSKSDEILTFAPLLEQAGADAITIHGRTKIQGYSGKADWDMIARVKKLVSIPVIANGDIETLEDIQRCLEVTNADGVMIGRGALGNPWIFRDTKYETIRNYEIEKISIDEIKRVVLRHAELHLGRYGLEHGLKTFRKHLLSYFKHIPNAKDLRMELAKVENLEQLKKILKK